MQKKHRKDDDETTKHPGFSRYIKVKGTSDTDNLFEERLQKHKEEIKRFYKQHPELKEKPFED